MRQKQIFGEEEIATLSLALSSPNGTATFSAAAAGQTGTVVADCGDTLLGQLVLQYEKKKKEKKKNVKNPDGKNREFLFRLQTAMHV